MKDVVLCCEKHKNCIEEAIRFIHNLSCDEETNKILIEEGFIQLVAPFIKSEYAQDPDFKEITVSTVASLI